MSDDPNIFWVEPVPATQRTPSTPPPPPLREAQPTTSNLRDQSELEIRLPMLMEDFANISINITPRRDSAQAGELTQLAAAPTVTIAYRRRETPVANQPNPSPAPSTLPQILPTRTSTPMQPGSHSIAQSSQVYAGPRPIYPLQLGEPAPLHRIFRDSRAHGYYVVFIGPCLGIYHEYWLVHLLSYWWTVFDTCLQV